MSYVFSVFYHGLPVDNRPCHFCRKPIVSNHRQYKPYLQFQDTTRVSLHQDCYLNFVTGIQESIKRQEAQHRKEMAEVRDPNTPFEEWTELPRECYISSFERFQNPFELITAKKEKNMSRGSVSLSVAGREIGREFLDIEEEINSQQFAGRTWTLGGGQALVGVVLGLYLAMNFYYGAK